MSEKTNNYFMRGGLNTGATQPIPIYIFTIRNKITYFLFLDNDRFVLSNDYDAIEPAYIGRTNSNDRYSLFVVDPDVLVKDPTVENNRIYLGTDENNVIVPSNSAFNFYSSTVQAEQWGIFLAGVAYIILNDSGNSVYFLLPGEEDPDTYGEMATVGVIPVSYFQNVDGVCEEKFDSLDMHLKWINGELNDVKVYTNQMDCENNIWYDYCPPGVTCGNNTMGTICKGPCTAGNLCVPVEGEEGLYEWMCEAVTSGNEDKNDPNDIFWITGAIVLGVCLVFILIYFIFKAVYDHRKKSDYEKIQTSK